MSDSSVTPSPAYGSSSSNDAHVQALLNAVLDDNQKPDAIESDTLDRMREQLKGALAEGKRPVEWLIRLDMVPTLERAAHAEGILETEPTTILGVKVRGSWKLLGHREAPLLVCEGDEMHRAIRAMYGNRAAA